MMKLACSEGGFAVGATDHHQHDSIAWIQRTAAMHNPRLGEVPAFTGLVDDAVDSAFRHSGIVLNSHCRDGIPFTRIFIAHFPTEADDRARPVVANRWRPCCAQHPAAMTGSARDRGLMGGVCSSE